MKHLERASRDWQKSYTDARAMLQPCICGEADDLGFGTAQLHSAAWVYCGKCGLGTPAHALYEETWPKGGEPLLWRKVEGGDAKPLAAEAWNAFVASKRAS